MSAVKKSKGLVSFEIEVERARTERRWSSVFGMLKKRPKGFNQGWGELLTSECQLEQYVERRGFLLSSGDSADILMESERQLSDVLSNEKDKQGALSVEASILLGKAQYLRKAYAQSLELLTPKLLDAAVSVEDLTVRLTLLAAEGHALRGLMLEEVAVQSQVSSDLMECYKKSSSLVFSLIDRDGIGAKAFAGNTPDNCNWRLGDILELAMLKLPVLYLQMGETEQSIDHLRRLLCPTEAAVFRSYRMTAARRLAQILLRGVSESLYVAPSPDEFLKLFESSGGHRLSLPSNKPTQKESVFVPRGVIEEALLLLLIVETMVQMQAEFALFPEALAAREESHLQAMTVYDLIIIALSRQEHYSPLPEIFDKAMKFSYDNNHIWRQFSLVLIAAGKYDHALSVLRQCHTMAPTEATVLFDAAKLCINQLNMAGEAAGFAKKLVALGDDHILASRGYLALGVAYRKQSLEATVRENAESLSEQALKALQKAHALDIHCTLTLYHLALQQAYRGEIKLSLQEVSKALVLEPYHPGCLHLMALLLSAEKQFDKSLMIAKIATEEWPDNFSISFTKARLEEVTLGGEEALLTCQAMLELWKQTYQEELEEVKGSGLLERVVGDKKDLNQMEMASLCGKDRSASPTQSLMALSTMSRGDVVSDAPSGQLSVTQSTSHSAIGQSWALQTEIWLLIADVYLRMERYDDATACLEEAKLIAPISGPLFFQMGLVSEAKGDLVSAKQCYESALAIMPDHVDSLVQLGVVNCQEDKLTMAEKYLREAVQINPSCHKAWSSLGVTLRAKGQADTASDCFFTAIGFESISPIVPFTTLPRLL